MLPADHEQCIGSGCICCPGLRKRTRDTSSDIIAPTLRRKISLRSKLVGRQNVHRSKSSPFASAALHIGSSKVPRSSRHITSLIQALPEHISSTAPSSLARHIKPRITARRAPRERYIEKQPELSHDQAVRANIHVFLADRGQVDISQS